MSFSLIIEALADTIGYNPLFACPAVFDLIGSAVLWDTAAPAGGKGSGIGAASRGGAIFAPWRLPHW